jgi:hypothetical protein
VSTPLSSLPPLLQKERGIKGVRLINNLLSGCFAKVVKSAIVYPSFNKGGGSW